MKHNFIKRTMALTIISVTLLGISSVGVNAEWKQNNNGWWQYLEGNSYITGWRQIDGKWYYFYPNNNNMASNTSIDGYWLDGTGAWIGNGSSNNSSNNTINNQTGWQTINGQKYYIKADGTKVTGWLKDINGKWYYLKADGVMLSNNWLNDNGKWYYLDNSGAWNQNVTGSPNSVTKDTSSSINNSTTINTVNNENKKTQYESIKTSYDLENYLNEKYSSLKTPIGILKFNFTVDKNDNKAFPYDLWIKTEWGDIDNPKYEDFDWFEPYDLEDSIQISDSDKEKTKELLKDYQKKVAEDVIKYFPNKKIQGGFFYSAFQYKYINEGYYSMKFDTWTNYELDKSDRDYYKDEYDNSELTDFHWDTEDDDYFND
ncbi:hypothetical protein [Clostridium chromiireducens]|uniref:hypothetical protein n=1 Tax=Clostridium chromiireducens TaxID=225345 RepID=UPI0013652CC3